MIGTGAFLDARHATAQPPGNPEEKGIPHVSGGEPVSDGARAGFAPESERLLGEISRRFLRLEILDLEIGIEDALRRICEATGADSGALLQISEDGTEVVKEHVSNLGTPLSLDFGSLPLVHASWLMARLHRCELVHIPEVDDLPKAARVERELLERRGVRSLVCVPIFVGERMSGIATFSMTSRPASWGAEDLGLMEASSEVLGTAIARLQAKMELVASREWLELAQRAGHAAAWEWHPDDDSMIYSSSTADVFDTDAASLPKTGNELMSFVPPADRERIRRTFKRVFQSGEPYSVEHRFRVPGQRTVWALVRGQPYFASNGRVDRVVGVSMDITERKRIEQSLRAEKERAQVTLASIGDGVMRTDAEGRIDFLNPAAERLIGSTLAQVQGKPVSSIYRVVDEVTGLNRANVVERCLESRRVVEPGDASLLVRGDGSEFSVRESAAPIVDREGQLVGAVLVVTDVSPLRNLQRRMAHLATHDPLTGLINRREFELRLASAVAEVEQSTRRFALCYVDLDDFKIVNDTCGHGAGDELLRQLTSVLGAVLPSGDTLARLGGDEFGILISDCSLDEASRTARSILDAVRQYRFLWENQVFEIGASVGIVPIAGGGGSLAELLSAADSACYVAKDRGRNQIHVSQPDDAEIALRQSEMKWVERINRALEENRFRLYRQPIRPLQGTEEVDYQELLLRLVDDDGEIVAPSRFIAAAERFRMMPAIDRWVVRAALEAIGRIHQATTLPHPVFAINLSGQSFAGAELLQLIVDRLDQEQIPADAVMFEITETAAVSSLSHAVDFISELRQKGCRFVLDDFGSGLSSFRYLRNLEVDFLKIDGELVRNIAHDPIQREMVTAIHRIGDSMGIKTIGEWVESAEVEGVLRDIGVDYAQGYRVGRPTPMESDSS
jgi:diguanylate cyclase (GGDEF)-like protein/PAS domain S-box-containing protein